jgi:hypothetical protein
VHHRRPSAVLPRRPGRRGRRPLARLANPLANSLPGHVRRWRCGAPAVRRTSSHSHAESRQQHQMRGERASNEQRARRERGAKRGKARRTTHCSRCAEREQQRAESREAESEKENKADEILDHRSRPR